MAYDGEPEAPDSDKHETEDKTGEPNVGLWISRLKAAKAAAKESWSQARRAWDEYLANPINTVGVKPPESTQHTVRFPAYWASTKNKEPAIYSRTPIPVATKTFDDLKDDVARLAGLSAERLARHLIASTSFDETMCLARDTFLHSNKTTTRVYFEAKFKQVTKKTYFRQVPVPSPQMGPNGQPIPQMAWIGMEGEQLPEGAQFQQDEGGFYIEAVNDELDSASVELCPVLYRDVLHTPNARYHGEIWWMAYRALMTKHDVAKRFGKEIADSITCYNTLSEQDADRKKSNESELIAERYAEVWEVWNKETKQVYWLCLEHSDDFLDTKDDPYGLVGFFPSPSFMLGSRGPDDLYPVPDFVQVEPFINQMHGITARLQRLIRAMRRRGLFDAAVPELANLANDLDEAEFLGVDKFRELIGGDGGIDRIIWLFPTDQFVKAISELAETLQLFEDKFDEMLGIPDIMKGVSDPRETASAQQLKGKYNSNRFSAVQKEFQRLVRDAIEQMCDLALDKFPSEKISDIVGVKFWEQKDQQLWPQVLEVLKNDTSRLLRIDIETDSTITPNMNAEIEQRNYLAKTLFEGFASVAQASEQNPAYAKASLKVLSYVVRGLQKGKEIEDEVDALYEEMSKPQQPAPDPEMVKAQGKLQIEQAQMQADIATTQAVTQAEMQREQQKLQNEITLETVRAQYDAQMAQMEMQIRQLEAQFQLALEREKAGHAMRLKQEQQAFSQQETARQADQAFEASPPQSAPAAVQIGDTINVGGTE